MSEQKDNKWSELADKESVDKTILALKANGFTAFYFDNESEAKKKIFEIIPKGAEVMDSTSVTLDTLGILNEINKSGNYDSVKNKLNLMDRKTQSGEMQKLGAAPDWIIGSAHAVTEDGKVVVASNTGSQLPAYSYASNHVILVVGTQKIVKNLDEANKRLYDYTLPLESERAKKAYGSSGSFVSKLLIFNREVKPDRITIIFINKVLGF